MRLKVESKAGIRFRVGIERRSVFAGLVVGCLRNPACLREGGFPPECFKSWFRVETGLFYAKVVLKLAFVYGY